MFQQILIELNTTSGIFILLQNCVEFSFNLSSLMCGYELLHFWLLGPIWKIKKIYNFFSNTFSDVTIIMDVLYSLQKQTLTKHL